MNAIVFLGGGRITSALAAGLRLAGDDRTIVVYDRHPEKVRALRRESGVEIARDLKSAVKLGEMLIIAVRPIAVKQMLHDVAECGAQTAKLCVSLAAGVPIKNLRTWLPDRHWVRAMPSPVCRIGRGLTALRFERDIRRADRDRVVDLFRRVGQTVEVPEDQFDAFTATYSSSHGYHALGALAKAAEDAGLDRETSLIAAAHALSDGILYWRQSRTGIEELLHEAATPGGIAATTVAAMDRAGYQRSVSKGIRAGVKQCTRNAGAHG